MDRQTPALHEMQCINYGFLGDLYLYLAHNTAIYLEIKNACWILFYANYNLFIFLLASEVLERNETIAIAKQSVNQLRNLQQFLARCV